MRKKKQEKRYQKAKQGINDGKPFDKKKYRKAKEALKAESFFYKCEVPPRQEDVPVFAKEMGSHVVGRQFDYESSIWSKWRKDTDWVLDKTFEEDIKQWKGFRFIKSEIDLKATENVLKKHWKRIKTMWHTV